MRCQKQFNILKFQNIILSVADSGVNERITLKSVIIYESTLFRPIWIYLGLGWMSARSAILKMSKPRGFLKKIYQIFRCFNAKTSVQITFPATLTGILVFLTYDHHVPCQKISFLKNSLFKKKTILLWLKIDVFFVAQWKQYVWKKLRLSSTSGHQYGWVVDRSCCWHEYVEGLRSTIFH